MMGMEYLKSIPMIKKMMAVRQPMLKTNIAKMFAKEQHITLQESFRLVNNCIRDGVLSEVVYPRKRKRKWKNKYIVIRTAKEADEYNAEIERQLDEKYDKYYQDSPPDDSGDA